MRFGTGTLSSLVIMISLILSGCGGGSSGSGLTVPDVTVPPPASLEVLHASQDAPAVNILVEDNAVASNLDFGASANVTVTSGSFDIQVDGILPTTTTTVIGPATLDVAGDDRVTVIAAGPVATIEPLILIEPQAEVAAGDVRVRVVHAASTAPMVDVYVNAPGTDITTVAPLGTFEFRGTLGPVTVPAGDYQIVVTVAGDPAAVAFDSGSVGLAGGSDLVVAAIANVATGAAAVELAVLTGTGSLNILDVNATADVRVVHASPDAPAVDVVAADNFAAPAVSNLAFPEVTPYLNLAPGDLNVKVVPTGVTTPVVIDADLSLVAGTATTVMAVNTLAEIEPLLLSDNLRRIGTEAQVRIVHASPSAGEVDIYVVAPGASIDAVDPNFSAVPFLADTGYVSLDAGDYDVVVTPTGTKTPAIGPATITVAAGGIYTAAARDEVGGGLPLGLILFDDF